MKNGNEWAVSAPDTLLPFLLERAKGSRNNIKSMLSRRQVLVDGRPATRFDHPLRPGQTVSLAPIRRQEGPKLPFDVLYEDDHIIVIDKPAGLLTIATDKEKSQTAYHILTDYMRAQRPDGRIYIVHRLDRDTSGVVLFAKTEEAKRAFQDDWDTLVKRRSYLAVVEGVPREKRGAVHSWLRETSTHLVYSSGYAGGGKEAITHYEVKLEGERYSMLEITIDTGRKNQIRVHMQDLGHPVAGDKKYGAAGNPLGRLGLHAQELILDYPLTGETVTFAAPTPKSFAKLCRTAEEL